MIAPFLLLTVIGMIAPVILLVAQSVSGPHGFTLDYIQSLANPTYRLAAWNSIVLSFASASVSLVTGGVVAFIAFGSGAQSRLGALVTSFSAVAANFAGVPLAFAFISTLGMFGLLTRVLRTAGIDIYAMGFSLYSISGLTLVYTYFLTPLMIILITPAIRAISQDWLAAAKSLGANPAQRLQLVVLPILAPSLISAFILLFGSAFSGYATAYALTSGNIVLLTTEIGNVLTGDVASAPQTGAALSVGMIVVMAVLVWISRWFGQRTRRWK
ncbi:ABC transporter permease [Rhizobium herbae]|uniref:Spermidine/putrescine transport system permease protein n=1 Tax=Rhizobium herbae TaxID=508661 RepID=A0ABS4EG05_9HYPH|nr:ABC transporter permease subunit [Rhizobium herbae]MBP1856877.1 putative spermidine/putrescine transport system permease protein [Rhizobium herbae]